MRTFYKISWVIFLIGLSFKFLHYPLSGLLLVLGTFLILVHGIIYFVKFSKRDLLQTLVYASIALITIYMLGRFQFWGFTGFYFPVAFLFTFASLIVLLNRKAGFRFPQIFLVIYFVFFLTMMFIPAYKIHFCFYLNTVLNGEDRDTDYFGWDKYSWFLYLADKEEAALEANTNAKNAVNNLLKITADKRAEQYLVLIDMHEQQIRDKTWTDYPKR